MESLLLLLLLVLVVGSVLVVSGWIALTDSGEAWLARMRSAVKQTPGPGLRPRPAFSAPVDPLRATQTDLERNRKVRSARCRQIVRLSGDELWTRENTPDKTDGYNILVWDIVRGNDFHARELDRSRGWFRSSPDPSEETTESRLAYQYKLNDDDKTALRRLQTGNLGQIPWAAAQLVRKIKGYPAWSLDFFDDHGVRVDVDAELVAIAQRATALKVQQSVLGGVPTGHLRNDPDVVRLYISKARLLDQSADKLVQRLDALAEYCKVVGKIQQHHERQSYVQRVGAIDVLDESVDTEHDHHESLRLQAIAAESEVLASVFLSTLEPLTQALRAAPDEPILS